VKKDEGVPGRRTTSAAAAFERYERIRMQGIVWRLALACALLTPPYALVLMATRSAVPGSVLAMDLLASVVFGALTLVIRRAPARFLAILYGVLGVLLVTLIVLVPIADASLFDVSNQFLTLVPVAIALFGHWPTRAQATWTLVTMALLILFDATIHIEHDAGAFDRVAGYAVGAVVGIVGYGIVRTTRREAFEATRRMRQGRADVARTNRDLAAALAEVRDSRLLVRKLEGILPVCAVCHKVRADDDQSWLPLETYLAERDAVTMSHGYCPDCYREAMSSI
jgi:hypothetical protein